MALDAIVGALGNRLCFREEQQGRTRITTDGSGGRAFDLSTFCVRQRSEPVNDFLQ
jgi:hypothetical protein